MVGCRLRRIGSICVVAMLLLMFAGCARRYYRNFADRDVYRIEKERAFDWRWQVPERPVEADPTSRIGEVQDPNFHPVIADDPAARQFQVTAGDPFEFVGWKRRGTAPIEDLRWLDTFPREADGTVKLDAAMAMQIALKNSRDYQTQVENVYLQALQLTLSRFQFFPQMFGFQNTQFRHFGAGKNESNQLQLLTNDGVNWTLYTGANLIVNFANSIVFNYNGKHLEAVTSGLTYSLTQPLLQGAWARNFTQPLSLVERQTLYQVRNFAHYRRQFYSSTVAGPPIASGYLQLLTQLQQIRNQRSQVDSAKRSLDEYDALVRAGIYNALQRDTIAQTYQSSRVSLLQLQASYQTSLDAYRVNQLGLPADFPLTVDETILQQFQLNDPVLDDLRGENDALYLALLQYDKPPDTKILSDALDSLLDEYRRLANVSEEVEGELRRWQKRLDERKDRVGRGPGAIEQDELESYKRQVGLANELSKEFALSVEALKEDVVDAEKLRGKLQEPDPIEAFAALRGDFVGRDLRARLAELFVIQTQVRVYLIELKMVDMTVKQGIEVALANRLDLMNALGQVTDAWRNVEVAGNSLLAGLNVYANGSLATLPGRSGLFEFNTHEDQQIVGIQFAAPINRRVQRNTYRANQITYQRARRAYMLLHDQIVQTIRLDMRNLNLARRQFEINREQLLIAARQLDQVEYSSRTNTDANSGAGGSAGLNLTNALQSLLNAKNSLISNWIGYESQRIDLFNDLDIMNVDANGVWTNDTNVPSFNGQPVPSTPDPVGAHDERILPGPATRPDPIGAGTGEVAIPAAPDNTTPPPPTGPGPFRRP